MSPRDPPLAFGSCPVPIGTHTHVQLGHGGGGRLTDELVRGVFLPAFGAPTVLEDAATLTLGSRAGPARVAVTTDAFVVQPRFFPGGDIGKLAVCGTVNDLAVIGAIPHALTAAFVLEEGLSFEELTAIVASMAAAAALADVRIVAGDTKVVERGKGDGVFIVTTGVGVVPEGVSLSVANARPGDAVILSGTLGDHGTALLIARGGLDLHADVRSDCAPLCGLVRALLDAVPDTRCVRDATRGGAAAVLHEIAAASLTRIQISDASVPVRPAVRAACEILGLDVLHLANEGKFVAVVPAEREQAAVAALRGHPFGVDAVCIGHVAAGQPAVTARSPIGGVRLVPLPSGDLLPRIC